MSNIVNKNHSSREKFIDFAKKGKILLNKCTKCNNLLLETVYFCDKCFSDSFTQVPFDGVGNVVTYTIQSVAPRGFEDIDSYAWVIFKLDNCDINVSGFLQGVSHPSDLPLGSKIKVIDFHENHGLLLEKL